MVSTMDAFVWFLAGAFVCFTATIVLIAPLVYNAGVNAMQRSAAQEGAGCFKADVKGDVSFKWNCKQEAVSK